ncbi:NAD(P)-dependent alcohol dehydrogenase [Egicoccus sp. AB-alg2]|uniref:NAD(P)-dependent alcohol dehydrogenase n=1 Tax=Egicoccus sp. AB-alg2 TaxID=3242693 RepID=UPI00359D6EC0
MEPTTIPRHATPDAATPMMRAATRDHYGPASNVQVRTVPRPRINDDEVLVRVHAAGVDRGVWHVMAGLPHPIRLAGFGLRTPNKPVLGTDVAGVVEAVGAAVTRFQPGDAVFGMGKGSFAEFVAVPDAKLATKPANLSFVHAAAMPVSGVTALQALRDKGGVRAGQKVLIIGASGGVGTFAVQIAKAFGAEVTAVCSPAKAVIVRSTGADRVLDYTREDFVADGPIHDVIIDIGGNSSLTRLRRALAPTGTLVITGGETGGRWLGGNDRQVRALLLSPFVSQTLRTFVASENHQDLAVLTELAEAGKIAPVIDRVYPLADAATAIQHVADGRARGKVVLAVHPTDHTTGGGPR